MVERTIISPHFSWFDEDGDVHTHWRGDIVQLTEEKAAQGDALNCFLETRVEYPKPGTPVVDEPKADFTEPVPPVATKRGPGRPRKTPTGEQ